MTVKKKHCEECRQKVASISVDRMFSDNQSRLQQSESIFVHTVCDANGVSKDN